MTVPRTEFRTDSRPRPFGFYTARDLWTDEHISEQMLALHLDESIDVSSRNAPFIRESVDWIVSHFGISTGSAIADFGCGPGLYATRLAEHHASVTGIDFSERSIRYARVAAEEALLSIDYVFGDYLEFETEDRFDLVLMIMCDFCALSPGQRRIMLDRFSSVLKPNGHLLLDVYSPAAFSRRQESVCHKEGRPGGFWSPNRHHVFTKTFKYEEEKVILDRYTIVEADRARTIYNWFQCFSRESVAAEFSGSGLVITEVYSDVAGRPFDPQSTEFAVVAQAGGGA